MSPPEQLAMGGGCLTLEHAGLPATRRFRRAESLRTYSGGDVYS